MPISLGILAGSQKKSGVVTGGVSTFTWEDVDNQPYISARVETGTLAGTVTGTGSGARFNITRSIAPNYFVTSVTLNFAGTGYAVGDLLSLSEINSPNDQINITVTAVA